MIDAAAPPEWGPGPMFGVDRVTEFRARHDDLEVVAEPQEIPGGMLMALRDPGGNFVYVLDQSTDAGVRPDRAAARHVFPSGSHRPARTNNSISRSGPTLLSDMKASTRRPGAAPPRR